MIYCNYCGDDQKIRCTDPECYVCAVDNYCQNHYACIFCASKNEKTTYEFHFLNEPNPMSFQLWLSVYRNPKVSMLKKIFPSLSTGSE